MRHRLEQLSAVVSEAPSSQREQLREFGAAGAALQERGAHEFSDEAAAIGAMKNDRVLAEGLRPVYTPCEQAGLGNFGSVNSALYLAPTNNLTPVEYRLCNHFRAHVEFRRYGEHIGARVGPTQYDFSQASVDATRALLDYNRLFQQTTQNHYGSLGSYIAFQTFFDNVGNRPPLSITDAPVQGHGQAYLTLAGTCEERGFRVPSVEPILALLRRLEAGECPYTVFWVTQACKPGGQDQ